MADPIAVIGCVADLWLDVSWHTLHCCKGVSKSWHDAAAARIEAGKVRLSAVEDRLLTWKGRIVRNALRATTLTEIRLHGFTFVTDESLYPLKTSRNLRFAALTYCTQLTVMVRHHLPNSLRELHIAGDHLIYPRLNEIDDDIVLDVHFCEQAVKVVEQQALAGFRFLDPAMRAGVRIGHGCRCNKASPTHGQECMRVPDIHGVLQPPEIWHASSFDWHLPAHQDIHGPVPIFSSL